MCVLCVCVCMCMYYVYIYSECLPGVPTEKCDLLKEGAPFPPDPPSKSWRPEYSVMFTSTHLLCES